MYELVNTSLPNGLIAGTHGFSTVAMTRGLSDALRTRLEAYCAYSHRSSAHDATYYAENPVNWFHVVLPQGEHVIGRVSPAEFDYTGRTNRLARLLVFPKAEMPAIGGAEVLKIEQARFLEPWTGDARWLELDKVTPGRLRLSRLAANGNAPAWRMLLGEDEGLRIARGFASLLSNNLRSGGKPIYFKTSAKYDVDGLKLLGLFIDLIELLPVDERRDVTFSTYPVSLPQGTVCHLRGVHDRDRVFDAAASTQPWIDCEKGIVYNAGLLPKKEALGLTKPQNNLHSTGGVGGRNVAVTAQHGTIGKVNRQQPQWAQLGKKDSGNKLTWILGTVVAGVLIVSVGVGGFLVHNETKRQEENRLLIERARAERETKEAEARRIAEEEQRRKNNKAEVDRNQPLVVQKQVKGKGDRETLDTAYKAAQREKETEHATQEAKEKERIAKQERERKESERQKRDSVAFYFVDKVKPLSADGIESIYREKDKENMTNGTLRVFWYSQSGALTNSLGGFVGKKHPVTKKTQYQLAPDFTKPEFTRRIGGAFIIWLDNNTKIAYWDWSPLGNRDAESWFAKTNVVDLKKMCFGDREEVYKTWEKIFKKPLYHVSNAVERTEVPQKLITNSCVKLDDLVKYEQEKMNDLTEFSKKNDIKSRYEEYQSQFQKWKTTYNHTTNCVETLKRKKRNEKQNSKKPDIQNDIDKKEKEIETINNEYKEYRKSKCHKEDTQWFPILSYSNYTITGWENALNVLSNRVAKITIDIKTMEDKHRSNKQSISERILKCKFTITVEGDNR